ncbi:MAG TPA: sigma-70 family RNA polymerase sigma factor [Candidatus Krumholzibacteria bacterium]|nr:sigma-70 family RNA polymerase sigma factor [Candidatus Krumholzibacteria bacterium]
MAPQSGNPPDELPSFDVLYERYGSRVLNVVHRMTGNEEVSRDLAQEVWLRVYRNLDRFEARADVFTWIYRIAVNLTLNHLKREKRRRWVDLLDRSVGEVFSDESPEPVASSLPPAAARQDRAMEDEQRARHLWEAIQALDPMYRVPIVLFHYEEQSYQEIADSMGLSMAAVQARIFRGRKQLAKILGPLLDQL